MELHLRVCTAGLLSKHLHHLPISSHISGCFQTKMLSQNVSPLCKRPDCILIRVLKRGAGVGGGCTVGGCCVVLCCVWGEGRGGRAELLLGGGISWLFMLTSVWLLKLVQRQRRRRRSLVPRHIFRWRRAGWFNSSSVSLCHVSALSPLEQASRSPNPAIVLIHSDLIYQCFHTSWGFAKATLLPRLNVRKAGSLLCSRFCWVSSRPHSARNSQDRSCESRSVFTLGGMTFNNNNNRRCLDLLAAMATGIRQRLLLCWWCPQKNRGANWQRLWDGAAAAKPAALSFIRKDKLVCYC